MAYMINMLHQKNDAEKLGSKGSLIAFTLNLPAKILSSNVGIDVFG